MNGFVAPLLLAAIVDYGWCEQVTLPVAELKLYVPPVGQIGKCPSGKYLVFDAKVLRFAAGQVPWLRYHSWVCTSISP